MSPAAWAAGNAPVGGSHGTSPPEPARSTATPAPALPGTPGPDPPSYKPEDAVGMLARMAGGRLGAKDIEAAFAAGVKNTTHVALYAKRDPGAFRVRFDQIYRDYVAWKDPHA